MVLFVKQVIACWGGCLFYDREHKRGQIFSRIMKVVVLLWNRFYLKFKKLSK